MSEVCSRRTWEAHVLHLHCGVEPGRPRDQIWHLVNCITESELGVSGGEGVCVGGGVEYLRETHFHIMSSFTLDLNPQQLRQTTTAAQAQNNK